MKTRSSVVSSFVLLLGTVGVVACSAERPDSGQTSQSVTFPDGATNDAPGQEVGDGWISGEAGSGDAASDSALGLQCPGNPGTNANVAVNAFIGFPNLQIDDDTSAGSVIGANANLVVPENDPADNSPNYSPAAIPNATRDWDDIAADANHRLLDNFTGKDPTAFPGSNSCVGAANNPPKDELLHVGLGSNRDFIFLNVLRAAGTGDMGYGILVTQERPGCVNKPAGVGGASCNGEFMNFDLKSGDVLIWGHFRTGSAKLLEAYTLNTPAVRSANDAIDFAGKVGSADLWSAGANAVAAVAINTDITSSKNWGTAGQASTVTGLDGQPAFSDHIFAEGAVRTNIFGSGTCGRNYWVTVITNSEGNDPANGDMKDLLGPRLVNFGSIDVTAHVLPSCDGTVDLQATIGGATAGSPPSCTWYIDGNEAITTPTCDYIQGYPVTPGVAHTFYVVANDSANTGCVVTSPSVTATSASPIAITDLQPIQSTSCDANAPQTDISESVSFVATATGGAGTLSYTWQSCTLDATPVCTAITGCSGATCSYSAAAADGNCMKKTVKVTVDDGAGNCPPQNRSLAYTKTTTIATSSP